MSPNKLFRILCNLLGQNMLEIKVEITQRILQTKVSQAHYIGVSICSDGSVNSMFEF